MVAKTLQINDWTIGKFIKSILAIQLAMLGVIGLDVMGIPIPIIRQLIGFLFLTILPGFLILQILKLNKIESTEKFILSVGISISFVMFFGLLLNTLSLKLGYETPLSTTPLLISFNLAFILLIVIWYKLEKYTTFSLPTFKLTTPEKVFLIVPVFFPALSIFGMYIMNATSNNIILMFMLFLIPTYVVLVCFFNQKFPERLYPVVIFLISVSLLLMFSLRSNHLIGVDTHSEYYFFQTTSDNMYWSVFGHSTLDACLAISVLPTIYQCILNTSPEFLFKILYSLLFSISPLIIYILSKKYVGEFYGFLTSCSFMFLHNFLWTPFHARTNTAILFFGLAMMILFTDKIAISKKRILFVVFMASCVVSHYSTTYVAFFIILGTFIITKLLLKKYIFKKLIRLTTVILLFILIFFWYSQVTETAFTAGVRFIEDTLGNLNKFFVGESRGEQTQAMLGENIWQKGIPHQIEFVLTWLTFVFVGIGVIRLVRRYKEMSFPELNFKKTDFLNEKFEVEYFVVALVCSGLLVVVLSLPYITVGYSLYRAHLIGIIILSIFFVIGGITLSRHLKVRAYLIILLVLIPYFLCVTGVMYNLFGAPRSILLNSGGEEYDLFYVHDQESFCAKWLKEYGNGKIQVYTDFYGRFGLVSQAGFPPYSINCHHLVRHEKIDGYIYLRYYNVVSGKLMSRGDISQSVTYSNITEYDDVFVGKNKVYANGGSEVHK